MTLEEMLGDAYQEGMSMEDINSVLKGKKFADLSTGAYVDKNKYDADLKAKDDKIKAQNQALADKMSDDEKKANAEAEKDALIESLQNQLKDQRINGSRSKAQSLISEARNILEIKEDDETFKNFIELIASENDEETSKVASYINKLVKDSYEKGKKDATRKSLGQFGSEVATGESGKAESKVGEFGKKLAEQSKNNIDPNMYFKRN